MTRVAWLALLCVLTVAANAANATDAEPESAAAVRATASEPLPVVTSDSRRRTAHSVGESSLLCAAA